MLRLIAFVLLVAAGPIAMSHAQSPDEQQACQNDAFRLCQQYIPDRERVFQCLVQFRDALSQICHAAIDRAVPPPPPPPVLTKGKAKTKAVPKKKAPVNLSPQ